MVNDEKRLNEIIKDLGRANKKVTCENIYADANWLLKELLCERKKVEVLHDVLETVKRCLETEMSKKDRKHLFDYIESFKDMAVYLPPQP